MEILTTVQQALVENWHVWFLSTAMIIGAVIDGVHHKVPNWLTFPLIISGWVYSSVSYAVAGDSWLVGLGVSLLGTLVGLALLLPFYSIGGMGAGDVKLLMGCGAWVHATSTFYGFCVGVFLGAGLAIAMVLITKTWSHHYRQFWVIVNEIFTVRDPNKLAAIAAERKSSMRLLPYGVPITIGTVLYFAWMGMLI